MPRRPKSEPSLSLFTRGGARKYLSAAERARFYAALECLEPKSRTFCEMIYWTGCRPGEALAMSTASLDTEAGTVTIRSLKKRGAQKGRHYRVVPLPRAFITRLSQVHCLGEGDDGAGAPKDRRLWRFGRTTGWKRMGAVMTAAKITGTRACARGLRHSFGVHAALKGVPETRIRRWLGHASLATTAIYLEMAALEDREMARRLWREDGAGIESVPPIRRPDHTLSNTELIRLLSAYSAIAEEAPRLAFLTSLETRAGLPPGHP
ncbi:site-specific integrase [Marivibrio halodurans]|uniref:Site-specific integrase n=1 Tax=Marivibrio halodurans TaxID=2039722 RepID=A0A8J7V2K2_9PROT|nr:site-specific integrase [Marivibrio halodurans]MBP5857415.1 site-specific integrase [Marivibrio halodurans]